MAARALFSGSHRFGVTTGGRSAGVLLTRHLFSSSCPFQILGISKTSSYSEAKKAFIQLALKHHPDTAADKTRRNDDKFSQIREAFESIVDDNGRAILRNNSNTSTWTDESLDAWFYYETGKHLAFHMDAKTRREVAQVHETMAPGGLDKGGMWQMAAMIATRKTTGEEHPLQVTCGRQDSSNKTTSAGRRRRKK